MAWLAEQMVAGAAAGAAAGVTAELAQQAGKAAAGECNAWDADRALAAWNSGAKWGAVTGPIFGVAFEAAAPVLRIAWGTVGDIFAADGAAIELAPGGGLMASENAGGHLLVKHIGKTEFELLSRALTDPTTRGVASSFFDRASAEAATSQAVQQNAVPIANWLTGNASRFPIEGSWPSGIMAP